MSDLVFLHQECTSHIISLAKILLMLLFQHNNNLGRDFLPLNGRNETRNHLVVRFQTFEGLKLLVCIVA